MCKLFAFFVLVILFFSSQLAKAQSVPQYEMRMFVSQNDTLLYRILYPDNYDAGHKYPVLLFLHGAGERGNDNQRQLNLGGDLFLKEKVRNNYPAIVVFPQCPVSDMWTARTKHKIEGKSWVFNFPVDKVPPRPSELVNLLMEELIKEPSVDQQRIYIMGISMGGIGALEFLHRWPGRYAAAAIICGGHDSRLSDNYKHIPVWFFHGDADDVVPQSYSLEVFNMIHNGNKQTRYTNYPNTNHNSWDKALAEPKLLEWMFNNKKGD